MKGKLQKLDDILIKSIRAFTAMLLLLMFVIIMLEVIFRYALRSAPFWTEELARYIMFYMVLVGSSAAYRYQQHPALGFITNKFKKSFRKIWEIIIDLIILSIHLVVFTEGYQMAQRELIARTPALRISFFWVYLALPVGAFMIMLQIVMKHIFGLKKMNSQNDEISGI